MKSKLKARIIELNVNKDLLANKLGLKKETFLKKLNGYTDFSADQIKILVEELEIPKEQIYDYFMN